MAKGPEYSEGRENRIIWCYQCAMNGDPRGGRSEWVPRAVPIPSAPSSFQHACHTPLPIGMDSKHTRLPHLEIPSHACREGWLRNGSCSTPLTTYPWPVHWLQSPYTLNPIGLVSPLYFFFIFFSPSSKPELHLIWQRMTNLQSGHSVSNDKCNPGGRRQAWMCTESDLVLTGTMPGKGRAWERSSINGGAVFSLGERPGQQVASLPAHDKGLGTLDKIADLALSAWSGYSNASPAFVLPNTKPCPDQSNRKPFVISGLGLSLRRFSEFMVHSGLALPYTRGCPVFEWNLGQERGKI